MASPKDHYNSSSIYETLILTVAFLLLPMPGFILGAQANEITLPQNRTDRGMVTSAHPLATQAGLDILKQGGNAIDAAIATTLAISVVEPFSAGIGGGGFLLFHEAKTGEMTALDFRERAPLSATPNQYLDSTTGKVIPKRSTDGYAAVAVPGTIAGLRDAHQRYGKLPWASLVKPSIQLARQGFPTSARLLQAIEMRRSLLVQNAEMSQLFLPGGKLPAIGQPIIQTNLARTLETIAQNPNAFYQGNLAQAIARDIQANGGMVTVQDLQQYRSIWRSPLCQNFDRVNEAKPIRVCAMPPPSSGGVHLLQLLNLVGLDDARRSGWHHPETLHRMIESMRIAYAAQRRLEIRASATPSQQVKAIDRQRLMQWLKESNDTSHLNVIDAERNAVSLTFTINLGFGAGVIAQGTGIILNNEMDDFAIAPNVPNAFGLTGESFNAIAPFKTPLSSMTPTIVTQDRKARLAVGAPGGSTIITTVFQIVLNIFAHDMDIKSAIASPRLHQQWLPDQTRIDRFGFDPLTIDALKKRGHAIVEREAWGNANGIQVLPNGSLWGAADPRGEGNAAGY